MTDPRGLHQSTPAELKERIEAERRGVPFLVLRDAVGGQRIVELGDQVSPLSVGRDPLAGVAVEWDGQVSRVHALLELAGRSWTVSDDGLSRNGTFVNGERVTGRRVLRSGDIVRVGETDLAYQEPASTEIGETSLAGEVSVDVDLSKTQRRVLTELCRPLRDQGPYATPATNQEIAQAVHLSEVAVKSHLRTLFAKFELTDLAQNRKRAALAEAALRSGSLPDRDF